MLGNQNHLGLLMVLKGNMLILLRLKSFHFRKPNQPQNANRPVLFQFRLRCLFDMPQSPMLTAIKTVSEAVMGILTLLLQVMVQQLEVQNNNPEEDPESPPEVLQTMESMVRELQHQREVLQGLQMSMQTSDRNQRSEGPRSVRQVTNSPPQTAPTSSAAASVNNSLVAEAFRQAQLVPVNRDFDQQPRGGHSTRTWAFVEESEEELIMEAPRRGGPTMTARPPHVNQVNRSAAARMLIEWGQSPITWGKKHRGKTFLQVLRDDPGYYAWSLARLASCHLHNKIL